jgi:hypothetical protein
MKILIKYLQVAGTNCMQAISAADSHHVMATLDNNIHACSYCTWALQRIVLHSKSMRTSKLRPCRSVFDHATPKCHSIRDNVMANHKNQAHMLCGSSGAPCFACTIRCHRCRVDVMCSKHQPCPAVQIMHVLLSSPYAHSARLH